MAFACLGAPARIEDHARPPALDHPPTKLGEELLTRKSKRTGHLQYTVFTNQLCKSGRRWHWGRHIAAPCREFGAQFAIARGLADVETTGICRAALPMLAALPMWRQAFAHVRLAVRKCDKFLNHLVCTDKRHTVQYMAEHMCHASETGCEGSATNS